MLKKKTLKAKQFGNQQTNKQPATNKQPKPTPKINHKVPKPNKPQTKLTQK